jgi:hypothetical protein
LGFKNLLRKGSFFVLSLIMGNPVKMELSMKFNKDLIITPRHSAPAGQFQSFLGKPDTQERLHGYFVKIFPKL